MRVLLAAVVVLAALGCGGDRADPEAFAVYHLELALGPPGDEGELRCGPPRVCPGVVRQPAPHEVRYDVREPAGLGEDEIDRAGAFSHGAHVSIPLTAAGSEAFARLTLAAARHGGRDQGWHHLAVVVGDEIVAFPAIDFDAYPNGIEDAPALQFGVVDAADARRLVRRLRGGQ